MIALRASLVLAPLALAALLACVREAPIEGAACNDAHHCPAGFACAGGGCVKLDTRPVTRCASDGDCVIGVCLEATGFCVQCERDSDCGQAACITGVYVCGCRDDDQCDTGRCNRDSGVCVSCLASEQCRSGRCDLASGVCDRIEKGDGTAEGGTR